MRYTESSQLIKIMSKCTRPPLGGLVHETNCGVNMFLCIYIDAVCFPYYYSVQRKVVYLCIVIASRCAVTIY